jgi:NADH:ubiquinone oxidoreductase subunit 2 (subunit N)
VSKWQIFVAGFETRNAGVELLVVFAAVNSVLSLAYYAPLVNRMYRNAPSPTVAAGKPVTFLLGAPLVALTAVVLLLGFWPGLVDFITAPAAANLVSIFSGGPGMAN